MLKRRINADRIDMLLNVKRKMRIIPHLLFIKRKQILTNETDTEQTNEWA